VRVSKKLPPTDAASSDSESVVVSTLPDDVLLNVKEPSLETRLETGDPVPFPEPVVPLTAASDCCQAEKTTHFRKMSVE
jgi:hypothetical protein